MQKNYPIYSKFFWNLYIVYELNDWLPNISNNFETIKSKFPYNGRRIAFYRKGSWSFGNFWC